MEKFKLFFSNWWQVIVFITIGLFLFFEGKFNFWCFFENQDILNSLVKLGEISIISGSTSFLLKSNAFREAYRRALTDVIYTQDILSERNDLKKIWENVSTVLFKKKFEEIHEPFLSIVRDVYFPEDNITYTSEVKHHLKVTWEDYQSGLISIFENLSFNVHTGTESKTNHTINYSVKPIDGKDKKEIFSIKKHEIEKSKQGNPKTDDLNFELENDFYKIDHTSLLEGALVYKIKQEIERKQILSEDDCFSYKAKYLINGIDLTIDHPEDMIVEFFDAGTPKGFETIKKDTGFKRYSYSGVILKRQGYFLTFKKKP